jgi:hypothetical protein
MPAFPDARRGSELIVGSVRGHPGAPARLIEVVPGSAAVARIIVGILDGRAVPVRRAGVQRTAPARPLPRRGYPCGRIGPQN